MSNTDLDEVSFNEFVDTLSLNCECGCGGFHLFRNGRIRCSSCGKEILGEDGSFGSWGWVNKDCQECELCENCTK